jgi:hypothetical protein
MIGITLSAILRSNETGQADRTVERKAPGPAIFEIASVLVRFNPY